MSKTKLKHEAEAKAVGLTLLGAGKNSFYRTYQFNECEHVREIQTTHVRSNRVSCSECEKDNLVNEAKEKGLTIVGTCENKRYRTYQFNDCGHEQQLTMDNVRNNLFRCDACFQEGFHNDAKSKNLIIIGKGKKRGCLNYQFIDCDHKQEIRPCRVKGGEFYCRQCLELKIAKEAVERGLILTNKPCTKPRYRIYKLPCKHEKQILVTHVRNNNFQCEICHKQKYTDDAVKVGLTLLGDSRNANYRKYLLPCSHEQEIRVCHVKNNNFQCQQCEETSRTLPSNVYLLKIECEGFAWLKYGYAKTVETRIKQYGLPDKSNVELLASVSFNTGNEAHLFEESVHKVHDQHKLNPEDMTHYMKSGGHECYPISMQDKLLKTLNEAHKNV